MGRATPLWSGLLALAASEPEAEALRVMEQRGVQSTSRRELVRRAEAVARGLATLVGREVGSEAASERCLILSEARPEWVVVDLACVLAGLISVPVFPNADPETIARVLAATGCRVAVVENPWQARKVLDAKRRLALGGVELSLAIVLIDEALELSSGARATLDEVGDPRTTSIRALEVVAARGTSGGSGAERKPGSVGTPTEPEVDVEECVTLCYTPGTEGAEKGVMWTHRTALGLVGSLGPALEALEEREPRRKDRGPRVLYLTVPLAQALGRAMMWCALERGWVLALPRSEAKALEDAAPLSPTMVVGAPSFFSRVVGAAREELEARGAIHGFMSRRLGRPAVRIPTGEVPRSGQTGQTRRPGQPGRAGQTGQAEQAGQAGQQGLVGRLVSGLMDRAAERMMRPALSGRFGERARLFVSGGGPLRDGVADLFVRCGVPLRECYGLVETTAVTHLDVGATPTPGAVGGPLPGVEQRLGEDGELFLRGPQISPGYWRDPAATAQHLDGGWFRTGDLAAEVDGQLVITGRKREIIVLSNGRTLAPRPIERLLLADPLIGQALVHGDRRDFVSLLVSLSEAERDEFASREGLGGLDAAALARHPRTWAHLEALVEAVNATLPPHARIKKFAILIEPLASGASLTPTGTLNRKHAERQHLALLDSFYAESF